MRHTLVKFLHAIVRTLARPFRTMHPLSGPLAAAEAAPVFILGAARSGNTLLRRLLMAACPIHIPPEMPYLIEALECYRDRRYYRWPALVRRTLRWFAHNEQFAELRPRLPAVAEALGALPPARRSFAAIVDAVYRDDATRLGRAATHWGDKTPRNARFAPVIAAAFPAARFVHLVRDGVDAVHSMMAKDAETDMARLARRWLEPVAAARAFARAHPGACLEVRYEELVREPETVLKRVADFCGLPCDLSRAHNLDIVAEMGDVTRFEHHAAVRRPVFSHSIGLGRRTMTREQLAALQPLMGATLAELGYDPAA